MGCVQRNDRIGDMFQFFVKSAALSKIRPTGHHNRGKNNKNGLYVDVLCVLEVSKDQNNNVFTS